jgi:hypothetical protein
MHFSVDGSVHVMHYHFHRNTKHGFAAWGMKMDPIMDAAIAKIEANAAAAVERAKRRDADKTYRFLTAVFAENDPVFHTGDHLFAFYATAAYCRRQRASHLRFIRQAVLLMGRCNTRGALLDRCKALRREELHRRNYSALLRNMADLDRTLNHIRTMELS